MDENNVILPLDHTSQGVGRLTSVFDDSVKLKAFLSLFLDQLTEIEDEVIALSNQKDLSTVEGVWLDYLGLIVGKPRQGMSDEDYRQNLLLKVLVNKSDGSPPVVSEVVKAYTESDKVRLAEGIMSFGQIIFDGGANSNRTLWELVQDIKPVTVKTIIVQNTEKKCFFPAWEQGLTALEVFYLVLNESELSEALELALSNTSISELLVSLSGELGVVDPDTEDAMFLEWEEPSEFNVLLNGGTEPLEFITYGDEVFQVEDENFDEDLVLDVDSFTETTMFVDGIDGADTIVTKYVPMGLSAAVEDLVLLPWEITRDSSINTTNITEHYGVFTGTSFEDFYVKPSDNKIEKYYVTGVIDG
ncbi:hypothetical protein NVP1121O_061 [Vibrio phage 1.121.O._10N.286.46.C4]|nr:hypothetical protein NVP1121O_061 [Vibrio phage 1.121.O._10N.286.46.C4]